MTQDVNAAKTQMPGVPDDVEEDDSAGPTLGGEHPIARPGIFGNVAFAAEPDVEAVKRVVENRQPDSKQLQVENKREAGEQLHLLGIAPGPRVANALETKCSTRNAPTGMMPLSE